MNKTKKSIGLLKFISACLPFVTLTQVYKLFIRPHPDDGDTIYHISHKLNVFDNSLSQSIMMENIELVQYLAALAITGTWKGSSRKNLYNELGWESLSYRRWMRRLILMFKIHKGMTYSFLKDNLPPFANFFRELEIH